jgi:hypothetical protein
LQDIERRRLGDQRTLQPLLMSFGAPANSDFFPYVDLNAPRMRFLSGNVTELPSLATLPLPLLDLLEGAPGVNGPYAAPPAQSQLFRDGLVRQSLNIRDAFRDAGSPSATLDISVMRSLMLIDSSEAWCRHPASRVAWRSAVVTISDLTSPYLPASELQPIWDRVRASPCYRTLETEQRRWIDLLSATAARDVNAVAELGDALLKEPGSHLTHNEIGFALVATAAAEIGRGHSKAAAQLLEARWTNAHPEIYQLPLLQLLALSGADPQHVR